MESLRPLLITYAYNILGSYEDARDVVQDVFLKFMSADNDKIEDKKAYLVRSVINHSINLKNRRKKLIDSYPGQWLPEPIETERADSMIIREEVLSYSLMVMLEKLNAKQRAVFILKEAFDYGNEDIAEVLDISVENSRKLLSRAKEQVRSDIPPVPKKVPADYINRYINVIQAGDTVALEQLLTDEITVVSDGGGKVAAFRKPVIGKLSVSALLTGVYNKFYNQVRIDIGEVNHEPALFYYDGDTLVNCQVFSLRDGKIDSIYFVRNPDKLKELQNIS